MEAEPLPISQDTTETLTPEQADALLLDYRKFPNRLTKVIDHRLLRELEEIIYGKTLFDADRMFLTGCMTVEETVEYMMTLPEFRQIHRRYHEMSDRIIRGLRANFNARTGTLKSGNMRFDEISALLRSLAEFQQINADCLRNAQMSYFQDMLNMKLIFAAYDYLRGLGQIRWAEHFITDHANRCNDPDCPHGRTMELVRSTNATVRENRQGLGELAQEADASITETELQSMFEEILDLSQFRKTDFKTTVGRAELQFPQERLDDVQRPFHVCAVRVICDNPEESLDLILDRATGEMMIEDSPLKAGLFIGNRQEAALKKIIYRVLLNFLRGKTEDIEERIQMTPAIRPQSVQDQRRRIQRTVQGTVFDRRTLLQQVDDLNARYSRLPGEKSDNRPETSLLRGLKGDKVYAALRRLLGDPVRVTGSHHFFTSRKGHPAPIAIHFGQDITGGTLRKYLQIMGIPLEEFARSV